MHINELLPTGGIIVSCQADPDTPTNQVEMIVAFALAAEMGGASGLRLNSAEHVAAVRARTQLPIIAIQKYLPPDAPVLITGNTTDVPPLVAAGAEIIAFDATDRPRPSTLESIVTAIHERGALALADIRGLADIERAAELGVDAIATTLSVWDLPDYVPDIQLIREIRQRCAIPIIAEGNFWTPDDIKRALDAGAHAVVIGSAITRPWKITEYYVRKSR
ncbi:MAG: putative N-acetylmannosamine-6-phosphate 2-epimerase [Anaerolineaceae bacterium]|nr:putative N-acetylmannosamine-6-phosphate 2-epimerase [Anaerolineaceae bacterium]